MSIDPKCIDHKKNLQSSTVLEHTGVPVTGTPSIYLEFNFIINRWAIYKTNIDGEPSINDVLNRWRTCDRYTCISRTAVRTGFSTSYHSFYRHCMKTENHSKDTKRSRCLEAVAGFC